MRHQLNLKVTHISKWYIYRFVDKIKTCSLRERERNHPFSL